MFGKPMTIGRIELEWEYPPEIVDISFMVGGSWTHFMRVESA